MRYEALDSVLTNKLMILFAIQMKNSEGSGVPAFGEAMAFYTVTGTAEVYVVYRPIIELHTLLKRWQGKWSTDLRAMPATVIQAIVGVWNYEGRVHILRKHPSLTCLSESEREVSNDTSKFEEASPS